MHSQVSALLKVCQSVAESRVAITTHHIYLTKQFRRSWRLALALMSKIIREDSFHSPSLAAFVLYVTYSAIVHGRWCCCLFVQTKGGKYYSSLLLMIMLDHCFCASLQQHHSSGRPRRRGLENGQSMRTVTGLARKWEMNLVGVLLVWSKKPSCG